MRMRAALVVLAIPAFVAATALSAEAAPATGQSVLGSPSVAPGGNFNLSVWQLQEPVGSPGSPTTISSSRLQGPNGFQDSTSTPTRATAR